MKVLRHNEKGNVSSFPTKQFLEVNNLLRNTNKMHCPTGLQL